VYQINNNVVNDPLTISTKNNQYVLGFSLDGQTLLYYFDFHIYWHDIIKNETTRTLDVSGVDYQYLELSPDGKSVLGFDTSTGKQGVYSLDNMDLLYELEENDNCGSGNGFSPDGKVIRSPGNVNNTKVCIWNANNGSLLRIIDTFLDLLSPLDRFFSPNGEILARSWSYNISLWSISDGSLIRDFDNTDTDEIHFSPNGDILAGLGSETVYLWDTNSWELLTTINTKSNFYRGDLIFSPDGKTLTLVGATNIEVWGVIS
jgi:Tol biopolymer transport system component